MCQRFESREDDLFEKLSDQKGASKQWKAAERLLLVLIVKIGCLKYLIYSAKDFQNFVPLEVSSWFF